MKVTKSSNLGSALRNLKPNARRMLRYSLTDSRSVFIAHLQATAKRAAAMLLGPPWHRASCFRDCDAPTPRRSRSARHRDAAFESPMRGETGVRPLSEL